MPNAFKPLLDAVTYDDRGLVVVIVQDHATNEVLMQAYMNSATLEQTLRTGRMTYWSRSRQEVWVKGATSGRMQHVREVRIDCDGDALLFKVRQEGGAACHTGHESCFHRMLGDGRFIVIGERIFDPDDVYKRLN